MSVLTPVLAAATGGAGAALPNLGTGASLPGNADSGATTILEWALRIVILLGVLGLLFVGGKLVTAVRHGEGGQHLMGLVWVAGGLIIAVAATSIVAALV